MPLYEFDCKECDATFDKLVRSVNSVQEVTCPTCGSRKVEKKISVFAAKMSGSDSFCNVNASACSTGGT